MQTTSIDYERHVGNMSDEELQELQSIVQDEIGYRAEMLREFVIASRETGLDY